MLVQMELIMLVQVVLITLLLMALLLLRLAHKGASQPPLNHLTGSVLWCGGRLTPGGQRWQP